MPAEVPSRRASSSNELVGAGRPLRVCFHRTRGRGDQANTTTKKLGKTEMNSANELKR